jgi:hypothetical protein
MAPVSRPYSREQLIYLLTEAAELEHNILCSYLYSVFSLKSELEEGLSGREAEAVVQWRRVILTVAAEELRYLAKCFPRHRCRFSSIGSPHPK